MDCQTCIQVPEPPYFPLVWHIIWSKSPARDEETIACMKKPALTAIGRYVDCRISTIATVRTVELGIHPVHQQVNETTEEGKAHLFFDRLCDPAQVLAQRCNYGAVESRGCMQFDPKGRAEGRVEFHGSQGVQSDIHQQQMGSRYGWQSCFSPVRPPLP